MDDSDLDKATADTKGSKKVRPTISSDAGGLGILLAMFIIVGGLFSILGNARISSSISSAFSSLVENLNRLHKSK